MGPRAREGSRGRVLEASKEGVGKSDFVVRVAGSALTVLGNSDLVSPTFRRDALPISHHCPGG